MIDPGHICDGNRGHYSGGCPVPKGILAPPDRYMTDRGRVPSAPLKAPLKNRMGDPEWAAKKARESC